MLREKALQNLRDIIRRSMSDLTFCYRDILDIDKMFTPSVKSDNKSNKNEPLIIFRRDFIDFRRRNFIRNTFSSIEAIIWCMKSILIEEREVIGNPDLLVKMQEFILEGPNKKDLSKKIIRLKLEENLKITIKTFDEILLKEKNKNIFSTTEWLNFQKAIKIRNRITHPKSDRDLKVSLKELDLVRETYFWFYNLAIKRTGIITKKYNQKEQS